MCKHICMIRETAKYIVYIIMKLLINWSITKNQIIWPNWVDFTNKTTKESQTKLRLLANLVNKSIFPHNKKNTFYFFIYSLENCKPIYIYIFWVYKDSKIDIFRGRQYIFKYFKTTQTKRFQLFFKLLKSTKLRFSLKLSLILFFLIKKYIINCPVI